MYKDINGYTKEILQADPSLPPSKVMEVSMRMFSQKSGASPAMSPGIGLTVTTPERRPKCQSPSINGFNQVRVNVSSVSPLGSKDKFRPVNVHDTRFFQEGTKSSHQMQMSQLTHERSLILERLKQFLPMYDEEVLRESLITCNWDVEKTSLFLLTSTTPQSSSCPSAKLRSSATMTKPVPQHLEFYTADDDKENEPFFSSPSVDDVHPSQAPWPLIDFEKLLDEETDNMDEWNDFLNSLYDQRTEKKEETKLQELKNNTVKLAESSSKPVLSFSKMSPQEVDKISSSLCANKAAEVFTNFALSQREDVKCYSCVRYLPDGAVFCCFCGSLLKPQKDRL